MLNLSLLSPGYSRRTNLEDRMVYVLEPVFLSLHYFVDRGRDR